MFTGPFTLDGADGGRDGRRASGAAPGGCSLLAPPRAVVDDRPRYVMLDTLRAYRAKLRAQAGEQDTAASALARYALQSAVDAAAGLQTTTGEVAAARRLDAEDPTMRQVLAWAFKP